LKFDGAVPSKQQRGELLFDVPGAWSLTADETARVLGLFNEEVATLARAHPGAFRAVGAVDPRNPTLAIEAIDRCQELGLDGVCIYPDPAGLDTPNALGAALSRRLGEGLGLSSSTRPTHTESPSWMLTHSTPS